MSFEPKAWLLQIFCCRKFRKRSRGRQLHGRFRNEDLNCRLGSFNPVNTITLVFAGIGPDGAQNKVPLECPAQRVTVLSDAWSRRNPC